MKHESTENSQYDHNEKEPKKTVSIPKAFDMINRSLLFHKLIKNNRKRKFIIINISQLVWRTPFISKA